LVDFDAVIVVGQVETVTKTATTEGFIANLLKPLYEPPRVGLEGKKDRKIAQSIIHPFNKDETITIKMIQETETIS